MNRYSLAKLQYEYKNIYGNTYESDELPTYNTVKETLKVSKKAIEVYNSKLVSWGHSSVQASLGEYHVYVDPKEKRRLEIEIRRIPNPYLANDKDTTEIRYVEDIEKYKGDKYYTFHMTHPSAHYQITLYAIIDGSRRFVDQSPVF